MFETAALREGRLEEAGFLVDHIYEYMEKALSTN
jgi:hypothetical protein